MLIDETRRYLKGNTKYQLEIMGLPDLIIHDQCHKALSASIVFEDLRSLEDFRRPNASLERVVLLIHRVA